MSHERIVGKRIAEVRDMTEGEIDTEGWDRGAKVVVLDDGTKLFASRDDEGNGPGTMFGIGEEGFYVSNEKPL